MANELKFGTKVIFLGGDPIRIPVAAADPGSASNGDMYYNSTSNKIKAYINGGWHVMQEDAISALTGDVTASGPGSAAATIANSAVTNAKLAQMPASTIKGNNTGGAATPLDLTSAQVTAMLDVFSDSLKGLAPASGGGTTNFLRADGTWAAPAGGLTGSGTTNYVAYWTSSTALSAEQYLAASRGGLGTNASSFNGVVKASAGVFSASALVNADVSASAAIAESKLALDYSTSSLNTAIGNKVSKSGDTMSGNLAMGGNKVTGLGAPSANGDALRYDMLGANNGIATLDGGGKVPVAQLPSAVMTYEGVWDASANAPTLTDGIGDTGQVYRVSVAGSQNLGSGSISFSVGDYVIYNSSGVWEKSDTTDAVASVNGQTGVVTVNAINQLTGDVTAGPASGSQSQAATIAAGAVTGSKIASDTITNSNINSAAAIAYSKLNLSSSIVNADVSASAAIAYSKLAALTADRALVSNGSGVISASSVTSTELGYLSGVTSAIQTQLDGKASTALSNLAAVAINTSLISDTNNTDDLGSDSIEWKDVWAHALKHNDASNPDLAISTTGNNGRLALTAHGTGTLDVKATSIRRSESGASSNYMEDRYFDGLSLAANTSSATEISSDLSFATASFDGAIINYRIKESTSNAVRIGQLVVSTDGTITSSADQFSETASLGNASGLSLSADVSGGNVRILFNNTHASNGATMRCQIRKFRA